MDNKNKDENNSSLDVIADEIRFAPGATYVSIADFRKDQFSQRYQKDEAFRQRCDEKLARSASSFANVRVINNSGDHLSAAAVKNQDGSIDAGITSPDAPNGKRQNQKQRHAS